MRHILGIACVVLSGCAQQMEIASSKLGEAQATLRLEAPELAGYITVPLMTSREAKRS